jgi:uncharacterized protein (TIGR03435 family)
MRALAIGVITVVFVWFNGIDAGFQVAEAQFDTVSIKRNTSRELGMSRGQTLGRETFQNIPVDHLIIEAYGLDHHSVRDVPDWARHERYDIVATYTVKSGGIQTARQSIRRMLQVLLEERFALQVEVRPGTLRVDHIERPSEN